MNLPRSISVLALILAVSSSFCHAASGPAPHINIALDATDAPRKIFHSELTIPAAQGTLTLYYPKWIPGEHAPSGPVIDLTGLKFIANGQALKWRRVLDDDWAVNVDVPAGTHEVHAHVDFVSPTENDQSLFSAGASATAKMAVISWNQLLLYPKGWTSDQITFSASVRLPNGWKFDTALPIASQSADEIQFSPVSLYTLVDSPIITGEYMKIVPLNAGQTPAAELDVAADSAAALQPPDEVWDHYKNLVKQATTLFGATHYRDYHFLLSLSDHVAHFGLEHHESDDSRTDERGLVDPSLRELEGSLLPHEYTHSWNGKYRRPADLTTSDYQQVMQDDLLWVYEGLTEYLGDVLAGRSGIWTPEQYRENLADVAARMDQRPGRSWRNLQDTADSAAILYYSPHAWDSWRRDVDFYDEGELDWLWADAIIRQQSNGAKSIDDFCKLFHGAPSTPPMVKTYTFDDVVNALNQIVPYDWRGFWMERLANHGPGGPLGGVEGNGWKLVYDGNRSEMMRAREEAADQINASFSIGLVVSDSCVRQRMSNGDCEYSGEIEDTIEGKPAAQAGIGPGMRVLAVNGRRFTPEVFRDALAATANGSHPFELLIENTDYYRTFKLDYQGGEKYPHLVRDDAQPDRLSDIIRAK